MYQPPNPDTRDPAVSGLGYRTCQPPNPDTRHPAVSGSDIPSSEFWTPDTRDPRQPGLGCRGSGVVPSSGHPIPETRQSRVSGIGCPELGTRSELRTPETRDPAVSGFGVRGLVHLGFGFGTENLTCIFLGLDLVVDVYMYPMCLIRWWLHQLYVLMEHI
ncbi:hypothetical protein C8R48DRAFT_671728 [Suillus tomentosus]|nr:hypothetical protein C8R48DRAFT_671728 [Suillus tomentosus]